MSRHAPINAGIGVPGMHPLAALNLYNSDGYDDPEVAVAKDRAYSTSRRRKAGAQPFAASEFGTQNPPCLKCEFREMCQSKQLACNIFAEWSISRRPVPKSIKRLLPSKKWMALLATADTLGPVRVAYYSIINKQTGEMK